MLCIDQLPLLCQSMPAHPSSTCMMSICQQVITIEFGYANLPAMF